MEVFKHWYFWAPLLVLGPLLARLLPSRVISPSDTKWRRVLSWSGVIVALLVPFLIWATTNRTMDDIINDFGCKLASQLPACRTLAAGPPAAPSQRPTHTEMLEWRRASESGSRDALQQFVKHHPGSTLVTNALVQLSGCTREKVHRAERESYVRSYGASDTAPAETAVSPDARRIALEGAVGYARRQATEACSIKRGDDIVEVRDVQVDLLPGSPPKCSYGPDEAYVPNGSYLKMGPGWDCDASKSEFRCSRTVVRLAEKEVCRAS